MGKLMSTKYSVIAKKPVEENIKLQGSLGKKFPCLMLHVRSLPFYSFYRGRGEENEKAHSCLQKQRQEMPANTT